jgi:hypothetical protein
MRNTPRISAELITRSVFHYSDMLLVVIPSTHSEFDRGGLTVSSAGAVG